MIDSYSTLGLEPSSTYDLSGGQNSRYNYTKVAKNQCKLMQNIDLFNDGSAITRSGRMAFTQGATGVPIGFHRFPVHGSPDFFYIDVADGLVKATDSSVATAVNSSGTNDSSSTFLEGFLFMSRRGATILPQLITDGTDYYKNGIDAPSTLTGALVQTASGTGNGTNGAHRVAMRWRSSITKARSNGLVLGTTTFTSPNSAFLITIASAQVSADPQVDIIDFFAQEANANADAPYFFVGSSGNAAQANLFSSFVSDAELRVRERLDVDDNPAPLDMYGLESWQDRILGIVGEQFVGDEDRIVQYSKLRVDDNGIVNIPTSYPFTNRLPVGRKDGDPLIVLYKFANYVFAFKRNSIWILRGTFDSTDFGFVKLKTNHTSIGLLNSKCIVSAGDKIFFVSNDMKFWYFSMTDFSYEQLRLTNIVPSDEISDKMIEYSAGRRHLVNLTPNVIGEKTQIIISFPDGLLFDTQEACRSLIFDYTKRDGAGAWTEGVGIEAVAGGLVAEDADDSPYTAYADGVGLVWVLDPGIHYDGSAYNGTSSGGNGANTLNDTSQNFGPDAQWCYVYVIDGTGAGQVRRILTVLSGTQVGVLPEWSVIPDDTSVYSIGAIPIDIWARDDWIEDRLPPDHDKRGWYLDLDIESSGSYGFDLTIYRDRKNSVADSIQKSFTTIGTFWNNAFWNIDSWNSLALNYPQIGFDILFKQISHRIRNGFAGQPLKVSGWTYHYQNLLKLRAV